MAIDIIASVVPNISFKEDYDMGTEIRFYVYLTPRISCSGKEPLENFKHIYNWTDYFCFFADNAPTFELRNGSTLNQMGELPGMVKSDGYRGDIRVTRDWQQIPAGLAVPAADRSTWAKTIWRSLVNKSTPVNGWELDRIAYKLLQKLDVNVLNEQMNRTIVEYKQQLLGTPLAKLGIPGFYDSLQDEEDQRAALIDILNHLYELSPDRKLASPYISNPGRAINFPSFLQQLHADLEDFNSQRTQEISDLSLKLSLQQVEENNDNETNEFHKKMAAFGNFPFLLKQTGWIWEYSVNKNDFMHMLHGETNFFIRVHFLPQQADNDTSGGIACVNCAAQPPITGTICQTPELLRDFQDNVRFSFPATNLTVRADPNTYTIDYGFKPNSKKFQYLAIESGLIDANPGNLIKAKYLEKNQLFDRITQILQQKYKFSYRTDQAASSPANQQQLQSIAAKQPPQNQTEINVLNQERIRAADNDSGSSPTTDYNSVGVSLSLQNLHNAFQSASANNPGLNYSTKLGEGAIDQFEAGALIFGHNLHKGYRADFFAPGAIVGGKSLTKRRTYYTIDFKKKLDSKDGVYEFPGCIVGDDEGWVVESAQGSNSGSLYVDGELFRYNDWSLSADRLFKSTDNMVNSNEQAVAQNSNISLFSIPQKHSLPRLRYGRAYDIVLRYVDICGGGRTITLDPDHPATDGSYPAVYTTPNPATQVTHLDSYPRTQGVSAPLAFLSQSLHLHNNRVKAYRDDRTGEDLVTMVIRSRNNKNGGYTCLQDSIRYIAPPKLEFDIVKKHGVFDALLAEVAKPVPNAASEKPSARLKSLITYDEAPKKLNQQQNTAEQIISESKDIDYLFDPLCRGYALTVDGIDEGVWSLIRGSGNNLDCSRYSNTYLDGVRYLKLILGPGPSGTIFDYTVSPPDDTNTIKIQLQQGMEKELNLTADLYGTLVTTDFPGGVPIANLVYHGGIARSVLKLKIVHAVQRPCLLYVRPNGTNFQNDYDADITTYDRAPGVTTVNITLQFDYFPCLTADTYILHVSYTDTTAFRKKHFPNGTLNTSGYMTNTISRVIKTGFMPDTADFEEDVLFSDLTHTFNDSKLRWVSYQIEAVSRFKKYFPDDITNFSIGSKEKNTVIKSSNPPPALEIDRIVPLIRWEGKDLLSGLERKCDTIRIYFTGDWYLSGGGPEDESVAVFFMNFNGVDSQFVPRELENLISQMGLDPATDHSTSLAFLPTIDELFFDPGSGILVPQVTFVEYELTMPIRVKNLDFANNGDNPYLENLVTATIYKVKFMPPQSGEDQGQYYIDIRIRREEDLKELYFPFIRFGISRYQENTIDTVDADGNGLDSRFSKVVVTDFVQLLPYRRIGLDGGGQLVYCATAVRATPQIPGGHPPFELQPNKLVYLPGKNRVAEGLTDVCVNDPGGQTFDLPRDDMDIVIDARPDLSAHWIIEEYERYTTAQDATVDPNMTSRENYSHRLIFNYFHQP